MLTGEKDALKTVTDAVFFDRHTPNSKVTAAHGGTLSEKLTLKSPNKSSSVWLALCCVRAKSHAVNGISGNDRLDGRLKFCLAQLFGRRSPHQAAAASHRSRGPDTDPTHFQVHQAANLYAMIHSVAH